ncbi:Reductase efuL [Exophiala dermatitidis]
MSSIASPACKKLLVVGATGLVGSRIIREIVRNKSKFERIAVFTSPTTAETKSGQIDSLKRQGVEIIVGDLTKPDDVSKAYEGIDTVISCLGRGAIEHQLELVRLANESPSVHRFFPSEYGTDVEYGPASAHEIPHQKKLKVRAALRSCDRLDHTFVVTGPYADGEPGLYFSANSAAKEAGSFDVKNKSAVLLGDGNLKISFTTMHDVGKLVVLAALHPDTSRNKALRVNSFTATDAEILAEFERQTGGQPWKVSYTSVDELRKLEKEAWAAEKPFATLFTLRRIWAEGGTLYDRRDNYLIDAEDVMDTLADAVAEAIKVQTAT